MDANHLLENHQSLYRAFHCTENALLEVHNDILRAIDDGHGVYLALLDLSAAFGTINHSILINRLYSMGIWGSALFWPESYLSLRTQSVIIDGVQSPPA